MQHHSLTAQITSKSKKNVQSCEPTFFSEIPYSDVKEINYLRDLEEKKKNIDFPIFQFEKDFGEEAPVNQFDMLANTLYKKIMQHGYIQQKKAPSKKKKKTKNPFDYDYEDVWINDQQAITVKKNIYVKIENFKCLNQGIEQFYNSDIYKSNIAQIQQLSKKRPNEISLDEQQLEEMKKKIKLNISIAHSKMKLQNDAEKPTNMTQNIEELDNQIKEKNIIQNLPQVSNENQSCLNTPQNSQSQLADQQNSKINKVKQQRNKQDQLEEKKEENQKQIPKKVKKNIQKQKTINPKIKKSKINKEIEQDETKSKQKNQSQKIDGNQIQNILMREQVGLQSFKPSQIPEVEYQKVQQVQSKEEKIQQKQICNKEILLITQKNQSHQQNIQNQIKE